MIPQRRCLHIGHHGPPSVQLRPHGLREAALVQGRRLEARLVLQADARAPRCCPAPSHLRGPSSGTARTHHAEAPTPCALNTPCAPPRRTQALGARHHRTPREPCAAAAPLPAACWCKPHRLCRVRALCALPAACWFCRCRRRCCRWQRPGVHRRRPGTPPWMWSTCSCEPFCGARAFMVGLQLQPDRNRMNRIVQPADSHKSTPLRKSPLVFSRRTGGFLPCG